MCTDVQNSDELGPQRHHDHEIENMGELYSGQGKQKETFLLGGANSTQNGINSANSSNKASLSSLALGSALGYDNY